MSTVYQKRLDEYYTQKGVHPLHFHCPYKSYCENFANPQYGLTEVKMSLVGSQYGKKYPKIVVISLDPPIGATGIFATPEKRTTEYVSNTHEKENYNIKRPNSHWAMTQIIVRDVLSFFGYTSQPNAAVVAESYAGRPIDNVSAYFAHVNVSKCSMNNLGKRQSAREVQDTCSRGYLEQEIFLLEPEILITQGASTNRILGNMLVGNPIDERDLPVWKEISLNNQKVLWLLMRHPTQQIAKIRADWPTYVNALRKYRTKGFLPAES